MKQWYMLTVVGQDRAGIVAALAEALYRGGANLGEASMARLGGTFAIMLMVETNAERAEVERWLAAPVRDLGLQMHIDPIQGRLHSHVEPNVRILVHGADRPGIVAQVTAALAAQGFNILDLHSDVGGTREHPIYILMLEGHSAADLAVLEQALAPLRKSGVEVRATAIETMVG
jgi:glycine cleavage system transcriptional repressor